MNRRRWMVIGTGIFLAAALWIFGAYRRRHDADFQTRDPLFRRMPADARAVFFVDLQQFRESQFAGEFSAWIPSVAADPEYSDFLQRTGFNFERDLQQLSLAVLADATDFRFFAVARGRFDQDKIQAYAAQSGKHEKRGDFEIFSLQLNDGRIVSLAFVNRSTVALTDAPSLPALLATHGNESDVHEWNLRFDRLAGSPIFAVIHQSVGVPLRLPAPNGLESPQLSALLDQLQWITIGGKTHDSGLQLITEGECASEQTTRQLVDLLNGMLLMAQAGLDTPQMRQKLAPAARDAYLELAKSADVTRLDRGDTKSVRLVFDITSKLMQAIRTSPSTQAVSDSTSQQKLSSTPAHTKKSPKHGQNNSLKGESSKKATAN